MGRERGASVKIFMLSHRAAGSDWFRLAEMLVTGDCWLMQKVIFVTYLGIIFIPLISNHCQSLRKRF